MRGLRRFVSQAIIYESGRTLSVAPRCCLWPTEFVVSSHPPWTTELIEVALSQTASLGLRVCLLGTHALVAVVPGSLAEHMCSAIVDQPSLVLFLASRSLGKRTFAGTEA